MMQAGFHFPGTWLEAMQVLISLQYIHPFIWDLGAYVYSNAAFFFNAAKLL